VGGVGGPSAALPLLKEKALVIEGEKMIEEKKSEGGKKS